MEGLDFIQANCTFVSYPESPHLILPNIQIHNKFILSTVQLTATIQFKS